MMLLSAEQSVTGPEAATFIGMMIAGLILLAGISSTVLEFRKDKRLAGQEDALRQLVGRYEQLAANTLDAQQRAAADVSELRSRTAAIEQILRSVE